MTSRAEWRICAHPHLGACWFATRPARRSRLHPPQAPPAAGSLHASLRRPPATTSVASRRRAQCNPPQHYARRLACVTRACGHLLRRRRRASVRASRFVCWWVGVGGASLQALARRGAYLTHPPTHRLAALRSSLPLLAYPAPDPPTPAAAAAAAVCVAPARPRSSWTPQPAAAAAAAVAASDAAAAAAAAAAPDGATASTESMGARSGSVSAEGLSERKKKHSLAVHYWQFHASLRAVRAAATPCDGWLLAGRLSPCAPPDRSRRHRRCRGRARAACAPRGRAEAGGPRASELDAWQKTGK